MTLKENAADSWVCYLKDCIATRKHVLQTLNEFELYELFKPQKATSVRIKTSVLGDLWAQRALCGAVVFHKSMRLVRDDPLPPSLFSGWGGGFGDNGVSLSGLAWLTFGPHSSCPHPTQGGQCLAFFTDPLGPFSSMDQPTLMMAPSSQQGVIQKSTSL